MAVVSPRALRLLPLNPLGARVAAVDRLQISVSGDGAGVEEGKGTDDSAHASINGGGTSSATENASINSANSGGAPPTPLLGQSTDSANSSGAPPTALLSHLITTTSHTKDKQRQQRLLGQELAKTKSDGGSKNDPAKQNSVAIAGFGAGAHPGMMSKTVSVTLRNEQRLGQAVSLGDAGTVPKAAKRVQARGRGGVGDDGVGDRDRDSDGRLTRAGRSISLRISRRRHGSNAGDADAAAAGGAPAATRRQAASLRLPKRRNNQVKAASECHSEQRGQHEHPENGTFSTEPGGALRTNSKPSSANVNNASTSSMPSMSDAEADSDDDLEGYVFPDAATTAAATAANSATAVGAATALAAGSAHVGGGARPIRSISLKQPRSITGGGGGDGAPVAAAARQPEQQKRWHSMKIWKKGANGSGSSDGSGSGSSDAGSGGIKVIRRDSRKSATTYQVKAAPRDV
jgi:hypothetical protein